MALIFWVFSSCLCFLGPQGHDDEGSSTSEDEGYPEDMDQDKHDDTSDDSDSDRSDVDSEGEEFVHHEDGAEREGGEDKKLGLSVRFADTPGKSRKKKKNIKDLTPLQAMMLRMAGQEIPEGGKEIEEFSEEEDDNDDDDSDGEETPQQQSTEESHAETVPSTASQAAQPQQQPPPQPVPPTQIQAPPMPGPPPLGPPPAPPLRPPGPPTGLPPGPPPGHLDCLDYVGLCHGSCHQDLLLAALLVLPLAHLQACHLAHLPGALPHVYHLQPLQVCVCVKTGIPPPRPGMLRPPLVPPPGLFPPAPIPNPGVLSAPPSLIQRPKADDTSAATIEKKATATISAKPQITNPKAEITRFVPTALRVRRENKGTATSSHRKPDDEHSVQLAKATPKAASSAPVSVQTKDDVYEAFMKEMEGLL
ncbi:hypothetical protein lerEdw1_014244 [Lerista edwardsae]|nr:hypothetical protein lerEdw1_014250 [Lerista edwardsae]KAJ6633931.1 hypothetical protein lerEdw1_014244 [Lerista edwardsae]